MRNKHAGLCYKCGENVEADTGYFERHKDKWRVQHVRCHLVPERGHCTECDHEQCPVCKSCHNPDCSLCGRPLEDCYKILQELLTNPNQL